MNYSRKIEQIKEKKCNFKKYEILCTVGPFKQIIEADISKVYTSGLSLPRIFTRKMSGPTLVEMITRLPISETHQEELREMVEQLVGTDNGPNLFHIMGLLMVACAAFIFFLDIFKRIIQFALFFLLAIFLGLIYQVRDQFMVKLSINTNFFC